MKKIFLTFVLLSVGTVSLQATYQLAPSKPVIMGNSLKTITELNHITRLKVRVVYKSGEERVHDIKLPGLTELGTQQKSIYKNIKGKNGNIIRKLVKENFDPKAMYLELDDIVSMPIFEWKDKKRNKK